MVNGVDIKKDVQPLADRIIVRPDDQQEETAAGILIPKDAQEKATTGLVISVGRGRMTEDGVFVSIAVKENDRIVYGKLSGADIQIGDEKFLILRETDVFAVLKDDK